MRAMARQAGALVGVREPSTVLHSADAAGFVLAFRGQAVYTGARHEAEGDKPYGAELLPREKAALGGWGRHGEDAAAN